MNKTEPLPLTFQSPALADLIDQLLSGQIPQATHAPFSAVGGDSYIEWGTDKALVTLNVEIAAKKEGADGHKHGSIPLEGLATTQASSGPGMDNVGQLHTANIRPKPTTEGAPAQ